MERQPLTLRSAKPSPLRERCWREWCFIKAVFVQFRVRLVVIALVLALGATLFHTIEAHSWPQALYFTWSLVFGQPPERFPADPVLRGVFFVIPVVGLILIIESLLELALIWRDRRRQEYSWCKVMAESLSNHIIIVGLGRLGYRTISILRRLNEPLVIIERNENNAFIDLIRAEHLPLLVADGRREQTLLDANIAKARSIVLASNDDLANLEIALDARRLNPEIHVVLRMFDQNMADKIREAFDINVAMSQSAMSAPSFAVAALETTVVNTMVVANRLIVAQRWRVEPDGMLDGLTVADVMRQWRCVVVELFSPPENRRLFPAPELPLHPHDEVIVQGTLEDLILARREET